MSATKIAICMGSQSDWPTMKEAAAILDSLDVPCDIRIISAHRTPDRLAEFARTAEAQGFEIIIAGAGGAAHLPGMIAAQTHLPVLGVPVQSKALNGVDSLYSIVQMPAGIPVATFAIGTAGAKNASLMAVQILSLQDAALKKRLLDWRRAQTDAVAERPSNQEKK
ncbi:MAG: 5-(carboxyamino)imidazole ribonucleotide mutase [Candidatus Puniceispirillaceae bacterium]